MLPGKMVVNVPPLTGVPPVNRAPGDAAAGPLEAAVAVDPLDAVVAVELDPLLLPDVVVDLLELPQAARTQPMVETERPIASPRLMMSRRERR